MEGIQWTRKETKSPDSGLSRVTGNGVAMPEDAAVAGWDMEGVEYQAESMGHQPGSGQLG